MLTPQIVHKVLVAREDGNFSKDRETRQRINEDVVNALVATPKYLEFLAWAATRDDSIGVVISQAISIGYEMGLEAMKEVTSAGAN